MLLGISACGLLCSSSDFRNRRLSDFNDAPILMSLGASIAQSILCSWQDDFFHSSASGQWFTKSVERETTSINKFLRQTFAIVSAKAKFPFESDFDRRKCFFLRSSSFFLCAVPMQMQTKARNKPQTTSKIPKWKKHIPRMRNSNNGHYWMPATQHRRSG